MDDEVDYEALSSNAGLGANMLAGALVSHILTLYISWSAVVFSMPSLRVLGSELFKKY
jgi:hypothetical protein